MPLLSTKPSPAWLATTSTPRTFDQAQNELVIARRTLPNNCEAFFITARIDRRQNRWNDSLANFQKAIVLDPRNSEAASWLAETYFEMRRYTELERLITADAANFPSQNPWTQLRLAGIKLAGNDPAAAQAILAQVPLEFSPGREIWDARFTAKSAILFCRCPEEIGRDGGPEPRMRATSRESRNLMLA